MGLLAVPKLLKEKYGHLYHTEHLSAFAHTRVFIDIASYLYKYVCTLGCSNSRWLNAFANLMLTFRKNGVIGIPVFDGQAPAAKADEQKERRELRAKNKERADSIQAALDAYLSKTQTPEQEAVLKREMTTLEQRQSKMPSLILRPQTTATSDDSFYLSPSDIQSLREIVFSINKQSVSLSKEDYADLKTLLSNCGITWLQAPEEAEAYCSWLVRKGYGTAVVSCDTDCLAHRADIVIFDVDGKSGAIKYVNTEELLDEWGLHEDQLIDFAILVGCDYNPGSRVNKIGPVGAIKLLKQYGRIEDIPNLVDISVLQHEKIRLLFNPEYPEPLVQSGEASQSKLDDLFSRRTDLDRRTVGQLVHFCTSKKVIEVK